MIYTTIKSITDGVKWIKEAATSSEFSDAIHAICTYMKQQQMDPDNWQHLTELAYYQVNEYSQRETLKNMAQAQKRVTQYLETILAKQCEKDSLLYQVLEHFYDYLDAMRNRQPHQKAGIAKEVYDQMIIENEYDIQFLLYAYLKPLFPQIRDEVSEDAGYKTVRPDFIIDEDHMIEVKCTRKNMTEKQLLEQIEADITHYDYKNIYFYIYDKDHIIDNASAFKKYLQKQYGNKMVYVSIEQPRKL